MGQEDDELRKAVKLPAQTHPEMKLLCFQGSGVGGLGFRVWGLGIRASCLGFRDLGFGFWVWGVMRGFWQAAEEILLGVEVSEFSGFRAAVDCGLGLAFSGPVSLAGGSHNAIWG